MLKGRPAAAMRRRVRLSPITHHPLVVERAGLQADGFGDAQAGGVAGRQDRLVFDAFDAAEKLENLRSAENGNFLGCLGAGMLASRFQPLLRVTL
jgi:hypothetical protein